VNIKSMLVRLEGALDRNDLMEQMVLLPEPASAAAKWAESTTSVNLVVGYNASPNSQTALDLTLWIAHQTRLVTQKQVTVQVVYVVDAYQNRSCCANFTSRVYEQADRILWQAGCLAEEWRSSFKAHLRVGEVATELRNVVESEAATLLFLGCNSVTHPIVQKLGSHFPCSVLGIPQQLGVSTH